jgi:hypothetical protein
MVTQFPNVGFVADALGCLTIIQCQVIPETLQL